MADTIQKNVSIILEVVDKTSVNIDGITSALKGLQKVVADVSNGINLIGTQIQTMTGAIGSLDLKNVGLSEFANGLKR